MYCSRLLLIILVASIATVGFSQTDFRKGYIITNSLDTLFGLVDYREGAKAYRSCDFKEGKGQDIITYSPAEIIGYGFINNKFFESGEILAVNRILKSVFLEVIVKGEVSLYRYEGTYYVEKKDDEILQPLYNKQTVEFVDGRRVLKSSNRHISTLNIMLFDCIEMRPRLQRVKLMERDLANLIEEYNRCKGSPVIVYKARKPWVKSTFGVVGGVQASSLEFNTEASGHDHLVGSFHGSKSPVAGLSVTVSSPRLSERLAFHGDLIYLSSRYYHFSLFENNLSIKRNYVTIEIEQLKVPISARYTFPERKFTPYFDLGISSTFHLAARSTWVQEVESNQVVETFRNEALSISDNQFGVWGSFGVSKSLYLGRISTFIELRYEQTDGISQKYVGSQSRVNSTIQNYQVIFGFRTK
jgi:hypothetical protein